MFARSGRIPFNTHGLLMDDTQSYADPLDRWATDHPLVALSYGLVLLCVGILLWRILIRQRLYYD